MKKIVTLLSVLVAMITSVSSASAQKFRDAEEMAQAFLLRDADHYTGYVNALTVENDRETYLSMEFAMSSDMLITNLSINGTNVPLPKPLYGLPIPKAGFRSFNMSLNALDKGGYMAASGYYWTNSLLRGDKISVLMEPMMPATFVPFPTENPDSLMVEITGADGWGWGYDTARGGFVLQIAAGTIGAEYKIIDPNGDILKRGMIDMFSSTEVVDDNSVVNVHQVGGGTTIRFGGDTYKSFRNQGFKSKVVRDGQLVSALVAGISDLNRRRLYIQSYGVAGVKVEVRRWNANSEMELVPVTHYSYGEKGGDVFYTTEYLDKAVVTIMPPDGQSVDSVIQYLGFQAMN